MNDAPKLTGPAFGPAAGGAPKQLVILLHGYGANGDDLIGLAPPLSEVLPDAEFLSPNAPYPCAQNPFGGLQWFDVWNRDDENRLAEVRKTAVIVDGFIDQALAARGLTDADLALVGFSQGTMLSLHVAMRRAVPCAAVLGFSGRLEAPETLPGEITARPKVMLIHGEQDELLPVAMMAAAAEVLAANGVAVETHRRPGLAHGIDPDGLKLGAGFLSVAFNRA
ncbi:MAG: dienelactone hydrolase family protein [Alphaproteobacteria bacterium]